MNGLPRIAFFIQITIVPSATRTVLVAMLTCCAAVVSAANQPPSASLNVSNTTFVAPAVLSLIANVTDSDGSISKVYFYSGTTLIGTDSSAPFGFRWSNIGLGAYSLTIKAKDDDGAETTSTPVNVRVIDPVAPTVAITAPLAGARVSDTVIVTADSGDNFGVAGVRLQVDGVNTGSEDTSAPYVFLLDVSPFAEDNPHTITITAVARDVAGNLAVSSGIDVEVANLVFSGLPKFSASADFSSVQGFRHWTYLDSTGALMEYKSATKRWHPRGSSSRSAPWISKSEMYPSSTRDPIRRWTAPLSGTVEITGSIKDRDTSFGDGVICSIKKNGVAIKVQMVANGDNYGYTFDVQTSVNAGDVIDFVVNDKRSSFGDRTYFKPTITFIDLGGNG